jgi:hypothetical protein
VVLSITSFSTYVICTQTQCIKPNTQISASEAEDVFELLNTRSQDRAVGHIVDIRKQNDLEEDEEPEPESKERTVTSFEFD